MRFIDFIFDYLTPLIALSAMVIALGLLVLVGIRFYKNELTTTHCIQIGTNPPLVIPNE